MRTIRRSQAAAICTAIVLLLVVMAGCGASKPVVKSLTPNKGLAGTAFKISGQHFGKTQA